MNGWTMCFVFGCTRLCQLTTNWDCLSTVFALPSSKMRDRKHSKQYKAKMELFSLSQLPLFNKCSSDRAWTWERSHKRHLFLNVEFFICKESQYPNIALSCCNYINFRIKTKKNCDSAVCCCSIIIKVWELKKLEPGPCLSLVSIAWINFEY